MIICNSATYIWVENYFKVQEFKLIAKYLIFPTY